VSKNKIGKKKRISNSNTNPKQNKKIKIKIKRKKQKIVIHKQYEIQWMLLVKTLKKRELLEEKEIRRDNKSHIETQK